jgi:ABC-type uncharacterized transport system permease subunit
MKPELKETDYVKAWILSWLCSTVAAFIVGAIVGAVLGAAMGMAGVPIRTIQIICGIAGFLVSIPLSYLFFRIFVSRFIVQKLTDFVPNPAAATIVPS